VFPLELDNVAWAKENYNDWATWPRKKSDDIFIRLNTRHECDRRTDTDRQLVLRLHIASRGKNRRHAQIRTRIN